jgi:hypothetical protein
MTSTFFALCSYATLRLFACLNLSKKTPSFSFFLNSTFSKYTRVNSNLGIKRKHHIIFKLQEPIFDFFLKIAYCLKEDYICLNCSVITQNGINRRMALAAEAFGNKMCFLEDITLEVSINKHNKSKNSSIKIFIFNINIKNVTPDFPACIFVLEQSLSVRALQEVVNSAHNSSVS